MRAAATLSGSPDVDAVTLALLQGWFTTGPAAVLPDTIERLVQARRVARPGRPTGRGRRSE